MIDTFSTVEKTPRYVGTPINASGLDCKHRPSARFHFLTSLSHENTLSILSGQVKGGYPINRLECVPHPSSDALYMIHSGADLVSTWTIMPVRAVIREICPIKTVTGSS